MDAVARSPTVAEVRSALATVNNKYHWKLDSTCQTHLTDTREDLVNYRSVSNGPIVEGIAGTACWIVGYGDVELKTDDGIVVTLKDVAHVPEAGHRLISLGKMVEAGWNFLAKEGHLLPPKQNVVREERWHSPRICSLKQDSPLETIMVDCMWFLRALPLHARESWKTLTVLEQSVEEWHRRYGHLGYENLGRAAKMVDGMSVNVDQILEYARTKGKCDVCIETMATRVSYPKSNDRPRDVMDRVHMDVVEMPMQSLGGT
ncbi:hypothetical protein VaNZ11_004233 [Volvox africanus]|uniref:Retrovirus-related Pol polyprotein from transposon TNT 1-94-like beta-barrel domain-containing protein n=1 Tax=Volvox africanus TaxID=51714 RepID=A0ABQ5RWM2_9CHLO|nr:hypothetical protein VaNZ11_004233 [Volvox africanus]